MNKYPLMGKCLAVGIILLFVGTAIIPSSGQTIDNSLPLSRGNTLYVGGNGSGNYTTIQDAIDNASNGDTIIVYYGLYYNIIIDKELTLVGINSTNGRQPCIHGNGHLESISITFQASGCNFSNFCWNNDYEGYGMKINSNNNTISHCLFGAVRIDVLLNSTYGNTFVYNRMGRSGTVIAGQGNNSYFFHNNFTNVADHAINCGGYGNRFIENVVHDFYLGGCFNSSYINNTAGGFQLFNSRNITIINNTFNSGGLLISGNLEECNSHVVKGNTLRGKPIYYYGNADHIKVPEEAAQIILANCTHCIISNETITADGGISVLFGNNNTIENNTVHSAGTYSHGIYLIQPSYNIVSNNYVTSGIIGIYIDTGFHNIISFNNVTGASTGIELGNSNNNSIENNYICNNNGITISGGRDNNIVNNHVIRGWIGISLGNTYYTNVSYNNISRTSWWGLYAMTSYTTIIGNCFFGTREGIFGGDRYYISGNLFLENTRGGEIGANSNISRNLFMKNTLGIEVGPNSKIVMNNFSKNQLGLYISGKGSIVKENNFIGNSVDAKFLDVARTRWRHNYWERPRTSPNMIRGSFVFEINDPYGVPWFNINIPWINFDWFPAQKPYEISGLKL
jgi:nitrous oxidase accessory protein